jgi:hypothetical protein
VNSDYYPVVDLGAEKTRFTKTSAAGFLGLASERFDLISLLTERRLPIVDAPNAPMEMPRVLAQAFSARMRSARAGAIPDTSGARGGQVGGAVWEVQTLDAILSGKAAPKNWHTFARSVVNVDQYLHSGAAGVVDEGFYAKVRAYLATQAPPEGATAVVDFLHGLGTYNFAEAARATTILDHERIADRPWIPAQLLRDGGAAARLKTGDVAGAEELLYALTPMMPHGREDLRTLLLESYARTLRRKDGIGAFGGLRSPGMGAEFPRK